MIVIMIVIMIIIMMLMIVRYVFCSIDTEEAPGGKATEARAPPPLHLVAPNSAVLLDWVLGLQPLCSVWPADRLSAARVRWRSLRVRVLREG